MQIKDSDIFYNYHCGDGLVKWTLCKYTPIRINNEKNNHTLLNHNTNKHHTVRTEDLQKNYSKIPFEATLIFKKIMDVEIEHYFEKIKEIQNSITKELENTYTMLNYCDSCENNG
jgi:phosphoribosylformylglycinamidine (FGAM) synthase-like amidotransferase family enzyme